MKIRMTCSVADSGITEKTTLIQEDCVQVLKRDDGSFKNIKLIDKDHIHNNRLQVINQYVPQGGKADNRYDVSVLVNGLPLVHIELKRRGVDIKEAFNQINRYQRESFWSGCGLFEFVQIFVISNGTYTKYYSNTTRFAHIKEQAGKQNHKGKRTSNSFEFTSWWADANNTPITDLMDFARTFFAKHTILNILTKYCVFTEERLLLAMRPYQIVATERIISKINIATQYKKFAPAESGGYIWHTTGSGKTLTSFKTAQIASKLPYIDKVLFVVDRHDLDTQTQAEYEAFEPGAVDGTEDTYELIKRLNSDKKIILTTIQKLNTAVKKDFYSKRIEGIRDKKVVMIFDECHRSHFGECHNNIVRFFRNLQIFGFTGTPIFVENAKKDITTHDVFGDCLHKYMIKDAIADENVLGFLVEYYKGKLDANEMSEGRMREIASFILNNFDKSTYEGEFNALFAVQSVPMLLKYYKIFKELNPKIKIAAIFTYAPNASQDDAQTGMNQGFETDKVEADELQEIMDDYNRHFGTSFTTDNFQNYYDDINERMKKRKAGMEPIDLLLVVGMFLTGFDAKKLNTLYVDKNLEYHGLLQAFSRTNRILNEKKRFGKILCFRDLKDKVDESIKLFSDNQPNETIVRAPYKEVKKEFNELAMDFLEKYPTMQAVDSLKSEYDKKKFLLAFRDIIKKRAEIQIYEDFEADDPGLVLSEQDFNDYRSKYLDMTVGFIEAPKEETGILMDPGPEEEYGGHSIEDIDFCLELLHSDVINVAYILALISNLNPSDADYEKKRQEILDTMIKDAAMRKKTMLIDNFIKQNVDSDKEGFERAKADGTMDLEARLQEFILKKKNEAVHKLAESEGVDEDALCKFISEYDYLGREKPEIIQEAVRKKKMGLMMRSATVKRVLEKLRDIIELFNWE